MIRKSGLPVFRKDHALIGNPDLDPIQPDRIRISTFLASPGSFSARKRSRNGAASGSSPPEAANFFKRTPEIDLWIFGDCTHSIVSCDARRAALTRGRDAHGHGARDRGP